MQFMFFLANIATIRSMSKNVFDGLYLVTNDVKVLEQNQNLILHKLDLMENKVLCVPVRIHTHMYINIFPFLLIDG